MAIESQMLKPSMKALRKSQVLWMADLSYVSQHSLTSTVFFLAFILICSFIFLTTVQHIFSQLFLRGVMRLGGIITECIQKLIFLFQLLWLVFSVGSMSCSGSIVDINIINSNCEQMNTRQERGKTFQIDRNPAVLAQSLLNLLNLQQQNLAPKIGIAIFTCTVSSLIAVQQLYEMHRLKNNISKWHVFNRLKFTVFSTFNIQACISFSFKTFLDNLGPYVGINWNQYIKGAFVGLFSYMRNTPIRYVREVQARLKGRNKQKIDFYQAYSYLKQTYGQYRLYPGRMSVNLLNSVMFFTLYFGVYSTLNQYSEHVANFYVLNPLIATIVATIPYFLVNKVTNSINSIKKYRQNLAMSLERKVMIFPNTVTSQFFKHFREYMRILPAQKHAQMRYLTSNWMQLMFFVFGQTIIHRQLCKNGYISDKKA